MASRRTFLRSLLALPAVGLIPAATHHLQWSGGPGRIYATSALRYLHSPERIMDIRDAWQPVTNHLYIDGREVAVQVVKHLREEARRTGIRLR